LQADFPGKEIRAALIELAKGKGAAGPGRGKPTVKAPGQKTPWNNLVKALFQE
jgi:hypothetical protein